jgi:glutamate-5-semialdehyde dehydrogenase
MTHATITDAARAARDASRTLASLPTVKKNDLLHALARAIERDKAMLVEANERDLARARETGLEEPKIRRLVMNEKVVDRMVEGLRAVAALRDPVGQITSETHRPNGLLVRRLRCPIGVIAMIYEARPAVTIDAFALCFKSGNAAILKGGREADASNAALAEIARRCLDAHDLPADALVQMTSSSREDLKELLTLDHLIDLVIPRGGESLIRFVAETSRIPTVQHYHGVCHCFVHRSADIDEAVRIIMNAKTSAPATCNALECALIDAPVARACAEKLGVESEKRGVELRGDGRFCDLVRTATRAAEDDWGREFLDLILAVRVVDDIDGAIAHISTYGSAHTDAICATDHAALSRFTREVLSSCVLTNASTRFNDGFELGLGAEIGISTQRVHAFGPMGLEELTVQRFTVEGDGQVRE